MGQIMNLFLLVEKGDSLYLIDQHAAHERILFDEAEELWSRSQELLVPLILDLSPEEERVFQGRLDEYGRLGFTFTDEGDGRWQMLTMPSLCEGVEDEIVPFFTESRGDVRELKKRLHATIACRKAVKDGAVLDGVTARELVRKTFALKVPRCPHGRPVWFVLTREELYRLVGREFCFRGFAGSSSRSGAFKKEINSPLVGVPRAPGRVRFRLAAAFPHRIASATSRRSHMAVMNPLLKASPAPRASVMFTL